MTAFPRCSWAWASFVFSYFSGSVAMLFSEMKCPRRFTCVRQKSHFFNFKLRVAYWTIRDCTFPTSTFVCCCSRGASIPEPCLIGFASDVLIWCRTMPVRQRSLGPVENKGHTSIENFPIRSAIAERADLGPPTACPICSWSNFG